MGVDVPLGLRPDPATRRRAARFPLAVLHLRPGRRRPARRLRDPRPQPRPQRFLPRSVHGAISAAKNDNVSAEVYADGAEQIFERRIADVYLEYQKRLLTAGAMDFDDLLQRTVELFRSHPDVLDSWRRRFGHVLVDEYQDTNPVQNDLVLMLGEEHRQVTVVGDSDQSIYRFRGADIRNILEFEEAFPDATVVVLEQNYRSTQSILDAANAVISRNVGRKPKDLWTDQGAGEKIVRYHADDEADEAQYVANEIARLHDHEQMRYDEMAVFYRANSQSRVLEEFLLRVGIPYKVVGGTRFYDRREVKDAIAYLRAIVNPTDEVSVKRVINTPKRGVGDSSIGKLDAWASATGESFDQAVLRFDEAGVTGRAATGIEKFLVLTTEIRALDAGPATIIEEALDRSGYLEELQAERSVEAEGRLENLSELVGMAREYETVDEFLEQISLVSDTDDTGDDESTVTLMTLHSAKGLEFPVVFIIGMEDGVFPHIRSLGEPSELEEERRLAYVGITRAMQKLHSRVRGAGCCTAPRSTTRRADSSTIPADLDEVGEPSAAKPWRPGRGVRRRSPGRRQREHIVEQAIRGSWATPSGRRRWGSRSATTSATTSGVKASSSTSRALTTRRRPACTSRASVRSGCCCHGRRSRRSEPDAPREGRSTQLAARASPPIRRKERGMSATDDRLAFSSASDDPARSALDRRRCSGAAQRSARPHGRRRRSSRVIRSRRRLAPASASPCTSSRRVWTAGRSTTRPAWCGVVCGTTTPNQSRDGDRLRRGESAETRPATVATPAGSSRLFVIPATGVHSVTFTVFRAVAATSPADTDVLTLTSRAVHPHPLRGGFRRWDRRGVPDDHRGPPGVAQRQVPASGSSSTRSTVRPTTSKASTSAASRSTPVPPRSPNRFSSSRRCRWNG
ncbi:MAG: 3'-5' exonuclease [Acidimicrobiales bacterium]